MVWNAQSYQIPCYFLPQRTYALQNLISEYHTTRKSATILCLAARIWFESIASSGSILTKLRGVPALAGGNPTPPKRHVLARASELNRDCPIVGSGPADPQKDSQSPKSDAILLPRGRVLALALELKIRYHDHLAVSRGLFYIPALCKSSLVLAKVSHEQCLRPCQDRVHVRHIEGDSFPTTLPLAPPVKTVGLRLLRSGVRCLGRPLSTRFSLTGTHLRLFYESEETDLTLDPNIWKDLLNGIF